MILGSFLFMACCIMAKSSVLSICKVTTSQVIIVSQMRDVNDNLVIQARVGAIGSDPSTWISTVISDAVSVTNNGVPTLTSNSVGDIIVTWTYLTNAGIGYVAAAILLHDTTTWYTATISDTNGSAQFADQLASLNSNGNALVTWTAYHADTNNNIVMGATALLSTSTVWSAPFEILN